MTWQEYIRGRWRVPAGGALSLFELDDAYWCGNCMSWGVCTEVNEPCPANPGFPHMGAGPPFSPLAWAEGENGTNHWAGMSGPGVRFPSDHSAFSAQPRLPDDKRGIYSPGLPGLLESIGEAFPGCPEPLWHFQECCLCPAHFPLFIVLPGWGPVKLASGSAALELRTRGRDGSGAALAAGGTVPDGHLVTAIGLVPSAYPWDTSVRLTQDTADGQVAEETHYFTVMDVKLWPDTDGDGEVTDGEKEAWAETNRADTVRWRVPAGGVPSLFELDDAILLEGYWTIMLEGGTNSNAAAVLFGDALAPVVVGCGESAEIDPWETRGLSHFTA